MSRVRLLFDVARRSGRKRPARSRLTVEPEQGWLDLSEDGVLELASEPAAALAPYVALAAAVVCGERRPGAHLREWLSGSRERPVWDDALRREFFALLGSGGEPSWALLETTGMLARLLPDVAAAAERRRAGSASQLARALVALREVDDPGAWAHVRRPDLVRLAALVRDAFRSDTRGGARRIAAHIGLGPHETELVSFLAAEQDLLVAASARLNAATEEQVLDVAAFVGDAERAAALYLLTRSHVKLEADQRERLDAMFAALITALAHPDLAGPSARDLVARRVEEVRGLLGDVSERDVRHQLMAAPRRYLLAQPPATIARHVRMVETKPGRYEARLEAEPLTHDSWQVHVATLDRRGVLAGIAGAFVAHQVSVTGAHVSTWRTGVAIDVFRVHAPVGIDWERVRRTIEAALAHSEQSAIGEAIDATISIDNSASPWHSIVEIRARDRAGLLHRFAAAMAHAGLSIHQASVATRGEMAVDAFWVSGSRGAKLDAAGERRLRAALSGKPPRRRRAARALREVRGAETRM